MSRNVVNNISRRLALKVSEAGKVRKQCESAVSLSRAGIGNRISGAAVPDSETTSHWFLGVKMIFGIEAE